jgi:hypothetical protein
MGVAQNHRDRSVSLDSAGVELLTACSKALQIESDPGSRGHPMESSQGPSDHPPKPDWDDDVAPAEADDTLSPQVRVVPLMRVYSLSHTHTHTNPLTRASLHFSASDERSGIGLDRHEPPARVPMPPHPIESYSHHSRRHVATCRAIQPPPTVVVSALSGESTEETARRHMGRQAAPSRKDRLDPFEFVGRRKHLSCSLEEFEAMRARPACASPTKEDSFCLCDDRGAAATNKFLLQNLLVSRRPLSRLPSPTSHMTTVSPSLSNMNLST